MRVEIGQVILELTEEHVEALRHQLGVRHPEVGGELLTASQLAQRLGVSREYVYQHATELEGQRLGSGSRGRWRFPATAASMAASTGKTPCQTESKTKTAKRRTRSAASVPLLEIRGSRPYPAPTNKATPGGAETPAEGLTKKEACS